MLHIQGLRKSYGDHVAVEELDLQADDGEVLALLGPNGAGKSTTVKCIVGLLTPDAGAIEVDGIDALADRPGAQARIGYVPELARLHDPLTPREFLALKGRLFYLAEDRIAEVTERMLDGFGLLERGDEPMAGFSKGMIQKVSLAAAMLTDPRLLVLDEPLSGLDVETTMVMKEVISSFAQRGGAVLYCSHMLDVVETIAHRVAVLDEGRLTASGTIEDLRTQAGAGSDQRLEVLFRTLTRTADPAARARSILGESSATR